jgi:hypothetical protein
VSQTLNAKANTVVCFLRAIGEKTLCRHFGKYAKSEYYLLSDCLCLSIRLSIRMEQVTSRWTDFVKFFYWGFLLQRVDQFKSWVKSNQNDSPFT